MAGIAGQLLSVVLPDRCVGCASDGPPLCGSCRTALREPAHGSVGALGRADVRVALAYEGVAVRLVRAWKEGRRRDLTTVLADLVEQAVPVPPVDVLTAVPGASDRTAWRGIHGAAALATELARRWHLEVPVLLERPRAGRSQRGLGGAARRSNVAGTFRVTARPPPRVCVVDDVVTTGATIAEARAALVAAGAQQVEAVAVACVDYISARRW